MVVYRVSGPLLFGAAQKAMAALDVIADRSRVVIFLLDGVPVIDSTGMVALESAIDRLLVAGHTAILHGMRPQPREAVARSGLLARPGVLSSHDGQETLLAKGRRALPVVQGGTVVGIITNGDPVQRGGLAFRLELQRGLAWSEVHAHLEGLTGAARTAADVMTARPSTVLVSTPLQRVADQMAQRRLKRLPVLDEAGALAGMVSRVDLLRATAGLARPGEERPALEAVPTGARVADVMRTDVPVVSPEAPLEEVLRAVVSTRLNKALVVDADRRVVGLVTDSELMDRLGPSSRPGLVRWLMQRRPASRAGVADQAQAARARARRAQDLMTTEVPVVTAGTPLSRAIASMLDADRKILAVVDDGGRLVGVVDRADLLRGIAAGAKAGPATAPEEPRLEPARGPPDGRADPSG